MTKTSTKFIHCTTCCQKSEAGGINYIIQIQLNRQNDGQKQANGQMTLCSIEKTESKHRGAKILGGVGGLW